MAHVPIEELLRRCGSAYRLVLLAAQRAKELADGAPPLVETGQRKVTSIALEEILQGKVLYKGEEPEAGSGKRSRSAKSKDEKRKRVAA
jgi:DNA-directed RNA polymerase subunit omega